MLPAGAATRQVAGVLTRARNDDGFPGVLSVPGRVAQGPLVVGSHRRVWRCLPGCVGESTIHRDAACSSSTRFRTPLTACQSVRAIFR